jgi:hypothetical protein
MTSQFLNLKNQNIMKKLLLISLILFSIFTSCTDYRVKKLQAENQELKDWNDTLKTWLAKERVAKSIDEYKNRPVEETTQVVSGITDEDFARKAFVISHDFIKAELLSPKSADFPLLDYKFSNVIDNTIVIESYVDAKNAFNAEVRHNYSIKLKKVGSDWSDVNSWKVISLKFK